MEDVKDRGCSQLNLGALFWGSEAQQMVICDTKGVQLTFTILKIDTKVWCFLLGQTSSRYLHDT